MSGNQTLLDIIINRRTIHDFEPERYPDHEVVLSALDAARWAPNHYLTEPWHIYFLGKETQEAICLLNAELVRERKGDAAAKDKLSHWRKKTGWILVTCDKNKDSLRQQEDYASCCCFIQNFSLALWNEGIGMKWSSGDVIRDSAIYEQCWIDESAELIVGLLWYGFPAVIPQTTRKAVEQFTVQLP